MSKAVISNRIYLGGLTREQEKTITDALTYTIETAMYTRPGARPKVKIEYLRTYKLLPGGIITIPQGRDDLIPEGFQIVDKRVFHEVPYPDPAFALNSGQQVVYDKIDGSCFLNAKVGWGKTFSALHIAHKLKQKTLVVVHTKALMTQWKKEAEKLFGMPVGEVSASRYDIEDHFIVVGNIQTLIKHKQALSKEFGMVILDEAHHVTASTFTDFLDAMYAAYRIGLSGTMQRKDGKHVLLTDYFAGEVHVPPVDNTIEPIVKILKPGVHLSKDKPWAAKINDLLYDVDYQKFIGDLVKLGVSQGHKVLVVASRTEFLEKVKNYVGPSCMLFVGTTVEEDRELILDAIDESLITSIAASSQIFSEGISSNILSLVILPEPISFAGRLEQIVGRVMRKHPDKIMPEVWDVNFSDNASKKQNQNRMALYLEKGWEIQTF